jgi:hypothetical protein
MQPYLQFALSICTCVVCQGDIHEYIEWLDKEAIALIESQVTSLQFLHNSVLLLKLEGIRG